MTARRQSVEYARCLSPIPLNSTVYLACECCHGCLRHTHTLKSLKCMHACTHTHSHTHTTLWNGIFSTICILTKKFGLWAQVPHMCVSNTNSLLRSSISPSLSECVWSCVCAHLRWQFPLACGADPSSTPTVNPVRPGVILTLTFGRWTRDVFFLLLLLPSHTFSSLVLSFPPSPIPPIGKAWPSITVTLWGHLPPC